MSVAEPLARSRRLVVGVLGLEERVSAQVACLASIGVLTALARCFVDLRLGVPGHSIVLVVMPLAFGLVCVPRRGAGVIMGGAAVATVLALRVTGVRGIGAGATTSLVLTSVVLEAALRLARTGSGVYLCCVGAGIASNLGAFLMRLIVKSFRSAPADAMKPLETWWLPALGTYMVCGAVAGLLAAGLLFRLRSTSKSPVVVGMRELVFTLVVLLAMVFAASRVAGSAPEATWVGMEFSERVGRELGLVAASRLGRGERVVIISGELEDTHSLHRRAEVRGLHRELKDAGIWQAALLRLHAATSDLDDNGGASADLILRAFRLYPRADAVVCLAGLPGRVPEGFAAELVIGFWKHVRPLRLAALGLFAISAAKLVLVDIPGVRQIYRILSFFVLGVLMIGAAYLYHRVEKLLEESLGGRQ